MDLIFNQALCASKYIFSNIYIRAIFRHYNDVYAKLIGPANPHLEVMRGLFKLISGKNQCLICQYKNFNVQIPMCIEIIFAEKWAWSSAHGTTAC